MNTLRFPNTVDTLRTRARNGWIAAAAVVVALAAAVDARADDDLPFARPGPDSAMIVGAQGSPAQFIYPVEFIEIDGRNIHPREVMWLAPGEYELTVRAFVTNPPGLRATSRRRTARDDGYNRITVVVEAGKEYSIGLKYDNDEAVNPYHTVLYRVEDD